MRDHVQGWLDHNTDQIRQASAALAQSAPACISAADWASWCQTKLVAHIDDAVTGGHAGQFLALSQRLAETGLLPMFGFPTRVRYLHLTRPFQAYPWPPPRVIDRDLAMAVSQFAPLSEVVRDGQVYPVVGVAAFRPTKPKPRPEDYHGHRAPGRSVPQLLLRRRTARRRTRTRRAMPTLLRRTRRLPERGRARAARLPGRAPPRLQR